MRFAEWLLRMAQENVRAVNELNRAGGAHFNRAGLIALALTPAVFSMLAR